MTVSLSEVMQAIDAVLAQDRSAWTVQQQADFLRGSQSMIEAMIDLQLRTREAQAQNLSYPPRTVQTSKG